MNAALPGVWETVQNANPALPAIFLYLTALKMWNMQLRSSLLLLLAVVTSPVWAQSNRTVLEFFPQTTQSAWQSEIASVPLGNAEPFIAFSLAWTGEAGEWQARFSDDGLRWDSWNSLHADVHAEQRPERRVSELFFASANSRYVQIKANMPVDRVEAHFYNPGPTKSRPSSPELSFRGPDYCPCPQPTYQDREDWCPDGTCPPDATPVNTTVTHLIVHHSAGPNVASDWAAVVRSFWDYHVNVQGWDDIGYNWLVDPNGVLYEGRGDNRLGAHFCGTNGGTMGVCVIGDFTEITPTQQALNTLVQLLAWKACDRSLDPLGSAYHPSSGLTLNNISGHRDGCSTACPGDAFYPMLPGVRQDVVDYIASSCSAIASPSNLVATTISETQINLEWVAPSDNETAFLIERSIFFNGPYFQIGSTATDLTTYEDTGLIPQRGYYYQVRAVNEQDTSQYSNKAYAFTGTTGTESLMAGRRARCFPNPARELLSLALDGPLTEAVRLHLVDATGRLCWSGTLPAGQIEASIPLLGHPAGIYMVQLSNSQGTATLRIVKE